MSGAVPKRAPLAFDEDYGEIEDTVAFVETGVTTGKPRYRSKFGKDALFPV